MEKNFLSTVVSERLKVILKIKGMTFNELAERCEITSNGLYLAFKRGKVTVLTLEKIAGVLGVSASFFFEAEIVERLTEEAAKHKQNPDLKSFLMGFSRDVSKGMPVERAAYKNINPDGFNIGNLL